MRAPVTIVVTALVLFGCKEPGGSGAAGSGDTAKEDELAGHDAEEEAETTPSDPGRLLMDAVDPTRYETDLRFVAEERPPGSDHWQAVQDRCAETFEDLGLEVERHAYETGVNVLGVLEGSSRADERIYLSAHYDHIPGCPGADDNATGVAGVLEAARVMADQDFARTVVFACWDEEEDGLLGARAQAARAKAAGETIVAMWSLEMIGYASDAPDSQEIPTGFELIFDEQVAELEENDRRGDFIALASDETSRPATDRFEARAAEVELPVLVLELTTQATTSPLTSDLQRSDHAAFWEQGYPGVMVTDTSNFRNPHYHCVGGPDVVEDLDLDFAVKVVRSVVGATADLADP